MTAADDAVAKPTLGTSAAKGLMWSAVSMGSNKFVAFASTVVLARLLDPNDFGVFAAALTLMLYLEVILDLGISAAVVYEQEQGLSERLDTAFTTNVLFAAVLTLLGLGIAPEVARLLGVPGATTIFRAMSFYLLIRGLGQVNTAVLVRDLNFRRLAVVEITAAAVRAGVSIGFAAAGYGVWAIVWGFLLGELSSTVMAWIVVRFRPRLRIDPKAAKSMLRFGLGVVALDILNELALNADYLVVANRLGATALGFYTLAYRLPELLVNNAFWVFSRVAFPVYSKGRTAGRDAMRDTMLRALRLASLFGFAVGRRARDRLPRRDPGAVLGQVGCGGHAHGRDLAVGRARFDRVRVRRHLPRHGKARFARQDQRSADGDSHHRVHHRRALRHRRSRDGAPDHEFLLRVRSPRGRRPVPRIAVPRQHARVGSRDLCRPRGSPRSRSRSGSCCTPARFRCCSVIAAGVVGGAVGLFLAGPDVRGELRELVRRLVAGRSATIDPAEVEMSTGEDRDMVAAEMHALLDPDVATPNGHRVVNGIDPAKVAKRSDTSD